MQATAFPHRYSAAPDADRLAALYQLTDWRWPAYTARFEDDSTFDLRARDEQAALSDFTKLLIPPYTVSRRDVIYIPVMEVTVEQYESPSVGMKQL